MISFFQINSIVKTSYCWPNERNENLVHNWLVMTSNLSLIAKKSNTKKKNDRLLRRPTIIQLKKNMKISHQWNDYWYKVIPRYQKKITCTTRLEQWLLNRILMSFWIQWNIQRRTIHYAIFFVCYHKRICFVWCMHISLNTFFYCG